MVFQKLFDVGDLVYDFCDISLCKPLRFVSIWNIEVVVLIEAHHPVKAGTVQKEKVQRFVMLVESVTNLIVIIGITILEFLPFRFEKCTDSSTGDRAIFYSVIKVDDVRVDVCKYGTFRLNIKANNTRPHKWLIPYSFFVQNHIFSNQGDKLCFNALNFKRRNEYFFAHFVLLLEALQLFNSEGSPLYCRYSEKEESFFRLFAERISILPKFAQ